MLETGNLSSAVALFADIIQGRRLPYDGQAPTPPKPAPSPVAGKPAAAKKAPSTTTKSQPLSALPVAPKFHNHLPPSDPMQAPAIDFLSTAELVCLLFNYGW